MPIEQEHIDAIARRLQRDVLMLTFGAPGARHVDYDVMENRRHILAWLDAQGIGWRSCGDVASERVMRAYAGQLYLDVPFDPNDAVYQRLQQFLEHDNGDMRFDDVQFYVISLDAAMKNKHHDEPGFWERWAEAF